MISNGALAAADFNYDSLVQLIQTAKPRSLDDIVPFLPKEYRQSFTLMNHSASLQLSSPEYPRVILFGGNAKTMITYGGLPQYSAAANLEVMQFNDQTKNYELHEIRFENDLPVYSTKADLERRCNGCHGETTRPLFDDYPQWLHAYGTNDDVLTAGDSKDLADFQSFRAKAIQPRYKILFEDHEKDLVWPYSASREAMQMSAMPNFRLALLLTINWAQHMASVVQSSELFQSAKYTLLYDQNCAQADVAEDHRNGILGSLAKIPADEHWIQTRAEWLENISGATGNVQMQDRSDINLFDVPYGNTGLLLRQRRLRSTDTGLVEIAGNQHSIDYVYAYLFKAVASTDPALGASQTDHLQWPPQVYGTHNMFKDSPSDFVQALFDSGLTGSYYQSCDYLEKRSKEELKALSPPSNDPPLPAVSDEEVQINRGKYLMIANGCTNCHATASIAPAMAFLNAKAFASQNAAAALSGKSILDKVKMRISSNLDNYRMPKAAEPLDDDDQSAILAYLNSISK